MGILFYLVFVGAGLAAAIVIQKALKAIKLI
ncbi:cytochrome b6-f complex subunit PetL [Prochlorococcus marinus]|uniref:Cytochrome B6 n=1 Tax=Prochlorococcus marinus XMU1408 TaxID=2213228 RepID=A0A318RIZ2_PROMR|nr:cytochrome b6-f complex subunit PetL [Prochlorococcus marinus]MBW3041164.1 cytochrome B6 [Prochlorococcus marinus str. XMU1408]PYE03762.1 cytochrome B6 [Prochlorococcus marinus XMU1408]